MRRTDRPLIYFISDGSIDDQNYNARSVDLLRLLSRVVSAKIAFAQIREKQLSTARLLDLARRAILISKHSHTKLLINDRFDIALAARADGVHLTSRSLRPELVRALLPPTFIIGVSTHSLDEVRQAASGDADFAVYGPVFDSPGKGEAIGLESLRRAADLVSDIPVIGLGGIDDTNYRDVLATGATGFAAMRFLNDPRNLETIRSEFHL